MGEIDPEGTEGRIPVDSDPDRHARRGAVAQEDLAHARAGKDERRVGRTLRIRRRCHDLPVLNELGPAFGIGALKSPCPRVTFDGKLSAGKNC